ncbi:uncharacterized protein V1516DRAFT_624367 [Lipomyces oligophaga]|uniref:uncharacterized protein n=1 Tax=Lipomyces oligophaga TaxID=45792 RepID=UPI0034CEDCB4
MIKTGATVLWQRLPIHMTATIPKLQNYAIYSDAPDVIDGHPVIDILAYTEPSVKNSDSFRGYQRQSRLINEHANVELYEKEANIENSWDLDKFKNIRMITHAYRTKPDAKWYIFIDGDSYVFWSNMFAWLNTLNPEEYLYLGSQTYVNDLSFAHGGSGVVLSGALVRKVFGSKDLNLRRWDQIASENCCGDFVVALLLREAAQVEVSSETEYPYSYFKIQGEPQFSIRHTSRNWCEPIVTLHHLTDHDVSQLREFERDFYQSEEQVVLKTPILYRDIYHKFVMPYICRGRRDSWDNMSDGQEINIDNAGDGELAHTSYNQCRQKCVDIEDCMQFKFRQGSCVLSTNIRLGKMDMNEENEFASEWMVDRIRRVRQNSPCDSLKDETVEECSYLK